MAHYSLCLAFWDQKKVEEAIACCRKAIELDPKLATAHYSLGYFLADQKKADEAIARFRKAIELDPKSAMAHNGFAWFLATYPDATFRDPKKAVELARQAVELAPTIATNWNTLGVARYRARDWKIAVEALHKAMKLHEGGDAYDWFFLAMAHWQLGEK